MSAQEGYGTASPCIVYHVQPAWPNAHTSAPAPKSLKLKADSRLSGRLAATRALAPATNAATVQRMLSPARPAPVNQAESQDTVQATPTTPIGSSRRARRLRMTPAF